MECVACKEVAGLMVAARIRVESRDASCVTSGRIWARAILDGIGRNCSRPLPKECSIGHSSRSMQVGRASVARILDCLASGWALAFW